MAAQALANPPDVSAATAILLFFQTMGGAFMVSSAQAAFTNTLVDKLAIYTPGILLLTPQRVTSARVS